MSYSFSLRAANKAAAKEAVTAKVAEVVAQQPVHAADQAHIIANAHAAIDLLVDSKEGYEVGISCSGYVSGNWKGEEFTELTAASIGAQAGWVVAQA
jgi:hypothetical protein